VFRVLVASLCATLGAGVLRRQPFKALDEH
jgi:hypothetical protein